MNFFEKIIAGLQTEAPRPGNYGWFHLMFVAFVIIATVLLCLYGRKIKDKNFRLTVGICWGVIVLFEIYKQLVFSYNAESDTWVYGWGSFPFQLCSTPIYVLPIIALVKDCKFRDGAITFISTFSFFGGLCVMVFPNDVFATDLLGVQIQTMVHHGLQVVLGIYIAVYNRKKFTLKNLAWGGVYFVVLVIVALVLNIALHFALNQTFNMFYISPYYPCTLPLLNMIYPVVPYVAFFFIYFIGFGICAIIMYYAIFGGMKLADVIGAKFKKDKNEQ